jgi:hypothetical protein
MSKTLTSHIDRKIFLTFLLTSLSLYIFTIWKCIVSQLIRYTRVSSNYSDFLKRQLHLRNRLLDQGYKQIRLIRSLKMFIFRYQDLSQQPENCENRNDPDLVQTFLKKWWVESDFKAPNLPLLLRLKVSGLHVFTYWDKYAKSFSFNRSRSQFDFLFVLIT